MVSVNNLSDPRELRNYLRDLIALSALPATWKAYEPQRIAESVAAALIAVLSPDFVYVSLPGTGEPSIGGGHPRQSPDDAGPGERGQEHSSLAPN